MTKIDQFESVFRSADKPVFRHEPVSVRSVLVVTDKDAPGAKDFTAQARQFLRVIFGANLGGNLTPIGSASTLVAVTIIHKNNIKLSFSGFVAKALPFAAAQIALATLYVYVFLR